MTCPTTTSSPSSSEKPETMESPAPPNDFQDIFSREPRRHGDEGSTANLFNHAAEELFLPGLELETFENFVIPLSRNEEKKSRPCSRIFKSEIHQHVSSNLRWSDYEEVILLGVIFESSMIQGFRPPWKQVATCYRKAIENYNRIHGTRFAGRTHCACRKHLKQMYSRVQKHGLSSNFWHSVYHQRWLSDKFNK